MTSLSSLRETLDLRDVINLLAGSYPRGKKICCPMPNHTDREPSFSIFQSRSGQRFQCWGGSCGVKGDVLDFIKAFNEFPTNREVIEWVDNNRNALSLDNVDLRLLLAEWEAESAIVRWWERIRDLGKEALIVTPYGGECRTRLEARGVDGSVHALLPVGCFDYAHLMDNGVTEAELKAHGLPWKAESYDVPILSFYYYSTPSTLSRIKLRRLGPTKTSHDHSVYGVELGKSFGFFCLDLMQGSSTDKIVVVEGEFDAMLPQSRSRKENNEWLNILCCAGSGIRSPHAVEDLTNLRVSRLDIWPDNDAPGRAMVYDIMKAHARPGLFINVLWPDDYVPPPGEDKIDPADYCFSKPSIDATLRSLVHPSSVYYVADWLAEDLCRDFRGKIENTREDVVRLQEKVLTICAEAQLSGVVLGNFLSNICEKMPILKFEVLWSCAEAGVIVTGNQTKSIGDMCLVVHEHGYFEQRELKDGSVREKQITDFRVNILRWVKAYDSLRGEIRYFASGNFIRNGCTSPILLRDTDFDSYATFAKVIHKVDSEALMDSPTFQKHYNEIIRGVNQGAPQVMGTLTVGHVKEPGLPEMYVFPNWYAREGVVYDNTDVPIVTDAYRPSIMTRAANTVVLKDRAKLCQMAKLISQDIFLAYKDPLYPLCLLGHFAASPIVEMLNLPKGILYLEGAPGQGKTLSAVMMMNIAWNYPIEYPKLSFYSTINSIERELVFFRGVPAFIDDAKASYLTKSQGEVVRVVQCYYDRSGRGRMTRSLDLTHAAVINAHLAFTGESLPITEESVLSRMVILNWARGICDFEMLIKVVFPQIKDLSSLWPKFIAWLQRRKKLEVFSYSSLAASRIRQFIDHIGTGLEYYLTFLHEEYDVPLSVVLDLLSKFRLRAPQLYVANRELQSALNEEELFIETLGQIISSNLRFIDTEPGLTGIKLGYRQGETIYVYPALAIRQVTDALGGRVFVKSTLAKRLLDGGYFAVDTGVADDGTVRPPKDDSNPTRLRAWPLKASKIFEGLSDPNHDPNARFQI